MNLIALQGNNLHIRSPNRANSLRIYFYSYNALYSGDMALCCIVQISHIHYILIKITLDGSVFPYMAYIYIYGSYMMLCDLNLTSGP